MCYYYGKRGCTAALKTLIIIKRGGFLKRKLIVTLAFVLLMVSASFSAFAADNIQLLVNGDAVPVPGLYIENDVSMIPVDIYTRLAGADVRLSNANDFAITENGETLSLTLGKKEALLGDKLISLPVEPVKTEENIFIPLRAVSSAFGFEVGWDGEQRLVTLTRNETRDGMPVSDLLVKSTAACLEYNTYSMEGLFNIDMDITADDKAVDEAPKNVTSKLSGQIQNDPFQVYMSQTITPVAENNIPEVVVETYMNQEKMYIKVPGQDWIVQDMPFSPEFWKQQQDIQSDPLKAVAQMKEMGILLNYGNDVTVNGTDYYVVNATLDMDKFRQGYQNSFQQATQGIPQDTASGDPADLQKQMQELFENADMEYNYSVLINKETLISDIIKFDARIEMTMENPEPVKTGEEQQDSEPQEVHMNIKLNGDITVTGLGSPFNTPDLSGAIEMAIQ